MKLRGQEKGIFISQRKYALHLLKDNGKLGSRPAETIIDPNHKLSEKDDLLLSDVGMYKQLLGRLLCLSLTHPEMANSVSIVSLHACS